MATFMHRFLKLVNLIRDNNLAWRKVNSKQLQALAHQRILANEDLAAQLSLKSVELAHNINVLKTRQAAELLMLKTRCAEDIKDYQQYLKALEQLKLLTKASFSHLPEAISLTIHHHAKSLLNRMWESENLAEKIKLENQLVHFMTTVHQEAQIDLQQVNHGRLPENTLKLMQDSPISS